MTTLPPVESPISHRWPIEVERWIGVVVAKRVNSPLSFISGNRRPSWRRGHCSAFAKTRPFIQHDFSVHPERTRPSPRANITSCLPQPSRRSCISPNSSPPPTRPSPSPSLPPSLPPYLLLYAEQASEQCEVGGLLLIHSFCVVSLVATRSPCCAVSS